MHICTYCSSCPLSVSTLPAAAAVLISSTVLSACPGDEIMINCYESDTTVDTRVSLRWEITPINTSISMIELSLSDLMNNTNRRENGLEFYAELTSYSPLRAILTTTAHSALDGARVTCVAARPASSDSFIIRVTQILGNYQ
jgi:hypothetical protein